MKLLSLKLIVLCVILAFAAPGHALLITPSSPTPLASGLQTGVPEIYIELAGMGYTGVNASTLMYKGEDPWGEAGLVGSYETTFNPVGDPGDADIVYTGGLEGPYISSAEYLLVKDGANTPAWYLFGLSGWDGLETIQLRDFWPNQGAISFAGIYGGQPVPEPATMLLFGSGLIGLAGLGRRKLFK